MWRASKSKKNCRQTRNKLVEISCLVRSIYVYSGSQESRKIKNQASKFTEVKQDRSCQENNSTFTYNSCASRYNSKENLQLTHRILRTVALKPENIETLALHAVIRVILLPFAAQHWSRFYSFQGVMGLRNMKNPK